MGMEVGNRPPACAVSCHACEPALAELAVPCLEAAVTGVDLVSLLSGVVLCVDDLPGAGDGWLRLDRDPAAGPRPVLTLYCGCEALRRDAIEGPDSERTEVWEQHPAPRREEPWSPEDFDRTAADAFFHHQGLLARDLLDGRLVPETIPTGLAEAFASAWDAVIDGRLARRGLPGYDQPSCRARFLRLFSSASVLMPDHWQIFQSLWEGGLPEQGDVLGAVRRLPRL